MFRSIFNTFGNCAKIPELKSRILFTFGVMAVVRLIAWIRLPGLNGTAFSRIILTTHSQGGGMLGLLNTFNGGALERCGIGTLGIMPYISATIIIQLLTAVWPKLSKLAREEGGRSKIIQYGRYLTVLLCLGTGIVLRHRLGKSRQIVSGHCDFKVRSFSTKTTSGGIASRL